MFTHTFLVGRSRALRLAVSLVLALGLVLGMMALAGCPMEDDDFKDDHKLNQGLIGNWATDQSGYQITETTLTYNDGNFGYGFVADIEDVYNFTSTGGVIIVKYTTLPTAYTPLGNYQGVYFLDLTADDVKLGNAYTVANYQVPVEVATLEEAKKKFGPKENIGPNGGELTVTYPKKQ
jgi:hypothetical protein